MSIRTNITRFAAIAVIVSIFVSCAKDRGNYTYKDIDGPEITGVESNLSYLVSDKMHLTPDLGPKAGPEDEYDFEWKAISTTTQEVTIIGNSKDLDYVIELEPDVYSLFFTATKRSSGLMWRQEYKLTVSMKTSEGWMVLCSDGGKARLDMVSTVTGAVEYDILKDNGMPAYNGPRKIQWLSSMTSEASPFYLLTDEGATRLGKNNFNWKPEYDFAYEVAIFDKLIPNSIVCAGVGKMTVSGTKAYYCESSLGIEGLYGSAVNKNFNVAPYIGANTTAMIYAAVYLLYDTDNKRFTAYCPLVEFPEFGSINPVMSMEEMEKIARDMEKEGTTAVTGDAFSTYPEGMDMVYMENSMYDPGNGKMSRTYAILRDNAGKLHLYGIQLGDLMQYSDCQSVIGRSFYGDLSGCTDLTSPNCHIAFSSLKNYMYHANGNKVYRVDLSEKNLQSQLQITLPAGEKITCMKFNIYQTADYKSRSYDLVVASESAGKGILRIYEGLNSEGDFTSVKPTVYEGFAKIVDVTYRERI